jgi:hypothetical protein
MEDKIYDMKDNLSKELEHVFDKFPQHHTKMLLGDFNAKVGMEDIFKPTIRNKSLYEISNDNGVRVLNFATSKNLIPKYTMFLYRNIHKFIGHLLMERQSNSPYFDREEMNSRVLDV